ncbi:metal ABC transporter solute-binding protein, Zn/Mn family [Afifella sp. IM 167]|uniref:zinc ABC transporter substrate-binding protein n=1 Tax=Afifella sp. IM 167 TaxID=2033586 RepID=UPI001CCBBCAC
MRAVGAALFWAGLAGSAAAAPDVVASIKPIHSLVAAVMKDVGTPKLLVEGAASPHTYALRPSGAAALQEADVVFWVGPEIETFLAGPLETLASGAEAVELGEAPGVTYLALREGGTFEHHDHGEHEGAAHEHEEHEEGETDAHVWLDPANAEAMVREIAATLAEADPANAETYNANAAAVEGRLEALTKELAADLEAVKGKPFIVFHDAFHYLENRFGLEAAGSITVSPEVSPGAQRIREIRQKIQSLGAACVFAEPQFTPKVIGTVTEGTGARSGTLDPLGADLADGPDLYFTLMRRNAEALKACLAN